MSELSELTLKFSLRENTGRNACRQMRASGRIPAILYGKELNKSLSVDDKEMRMLLRQASGTSSLMRLIGDQGEDELVLIKEMQKDHIKDRILHIDFIQVTRGEDLQTRVPLVLIGDAEGVKTSGGILEVLANDIEIRCRPSNLPSQIELNISSLALGENLQVKDLPEVDGVTFVTPEDSMIVSCVGSASGRSDAEEEGDVPTDESEASEEEATEESSEEETASEEESS
ncbi:MAG: 50S ribosomal protein L25 [Verrucomicrobiota bacterium]